MGDREKANPFKWNCEWQEGVGIPAETRRALERENRNLGPHQKRVILDQGLYPLVDAQALERWDYMLSCCSLAH